MTSQNRSIIQFQAGGFRLAIPMAFVTSILGEASIKRNDKAIRPYGWLEVSDKDLPIIDLGACLGSRSHVLGSTCQFIILEQDGRNLVLLVQKVLSVQKQGEQAFKDLLTPVHHLSHSLILAASQENPTVFLLDFEGLAHLAGLETKPFLPELPRFMDPALSETPMSPTMLSFSSHQENRGPRWGLSTSQVAEILKVDTLETLPVVPHYFLGFLWWREQPIPIVDLNLRQGHLEQTVLDRVLIARMGSQNAYLGFSCHSDMRIEKDLTHFQPLELNPEEHPSFAIGAYVRDEEVVVIPNLEAILA